MFTIKQKEILVYYDSPQLFVGQDAFGTSYLCVLCEAAPTWQYLAVPISNPRLTAIKNGLFDVSQAYRQPERSLYWTLRPEADVSGYTASSVVPGEIPESWFPDTDLYIHCLEPPIKLIRMAQDYNSAIIELHLQPEEAEVAPKIRVQKLTAGLKVFQRLVSHGYRKAVGELDERTRRVLDQLTYHQLNVRALLPGSFTVVLETEASADMFGYSEVAKAFDKIDRLHALLGSPDESVDYLRRYRGHFASAYRDLIKFVVETNTPVTYQWAMPTTKDVPPHQFFPAEVQELYKHLMLREDISTETMVLLGLVVKVDLPYRTWRIQEADTGIQFSGRILPDSDLSLEGITVGTERYRFHCIEKIEEETGTGKEHKVLYLTNYERA